MKRVSRSCGESVALETLESRAMMAADLVPGGITVRVPDFVSGGPFPGEWIRNMTFSVVNMGDRRAPVGTRVRFYLSRDGVLDGSDRAIRDSVLPAPVRPGERVTYTKVLSVPRGMDGGTYNVIMQIDPGNSITESNELNNTLPSAPQTFALQPRVGSVEIDKRYLRPGSYATLTARNVTNMDPDAGEVSFYRALPPAYSGNVLFSPRVLIGVGVREGADYHISLVADEAWLATTNYFVAEARKHNGQSYPASVSVESRNVGPTVASIAFSPSGLVRGQSVSFTASGASANTSFVQVFFDSNFDGIYTPDNYPYHAGDTLLATATQSGTSWNASFVVPTWFPGAPTRVFVVVTAGTPNFARRIYSVQLSAHD
jgi:hypothetical protein